MKFGEEFVERGKIVLKKSIFFKCIIISILYKVYIIVDNIIIDI